MAVAGGLHGCVLSTKFRTPTAAMSAESNRSKRLRSPPPVLISVNPSDVNPYRLRDLYSLSNYSCHRFPNIGSDGQADPVDLDKLCIALSHSSVVVSVFTKPEVVSYYSASSKFANSSSEFSTLIGVGGDWFRRLRPVTPSNGQLVGFGRAVSDDGLTASIYDVMVIPPLRGMGIGRMIVERIVRVLTSRGICDIAALCTDKERVFFEACGFGDDILGATTMMYARTVSGCEENQLARRVGRKLLLVPQVREPFK